MTTPSELLAIYSNQTQVSEFFVDKLGIISILSYANGKAIYGGTESAVQALTDAINETPESGGYIFLPSTENGGTYVIDSDVTIPSRVTLWFAKGAKIKRKNGATITLNCGIIAERHLIFTDDGTGKLVGNSLICEIYPEWFGDDLSKTIKFAQSYYETRTGGVSSNPPEIKLAGKTYTVNSELDDLTEPSKQTSNVTGERPSIKFSGVGNTSTRILYKKTNSTMLKIYNIKVKFSDICFWGNDSSVLLQLGKDDTTKLYQVREAEFSDCTFRSNTCLKVYRIFDSTFKDCYFSLLGTNGAAIDVMEPSFDNSNNVNFWRCHLENTFGNSKWIKARGNENADGYLFGFNFVGCHFETRAYTTKILDLYRCNGWTFDRCQFTQNRLISQEDTVDDSVNVCVLEDVFGINFNNCTFNRTGDKSGLPKYFKFIGIANSVNFNGGVAPTINGGNGGRADFIDDSECTTKRGIMLNGIQLTASQNKNTHNDRIMLTGNSANREWQIFNEDKDGSNFNIHFAHSATTSSDILTKEDADASLSNAGNFRAPLGFSGTGITIEDDDTYQFGLHSSIESHRRGVYLILFSTSTGQEWAMVYGTGTTLITIQAGTGINNGGSSNNDIDGKINIWSSITGVINIKNRYGSTLKGNIIPFSFGDNF